MEKENGSSPKPEEPAKLGAPSRNGEAESPQEPRSGSSASSRQPSTSDTPQYVPLDKAASRRPLLRRLPEYAWKVLAAVAILAGMVGVVLVLFFGVDSFCDVFPSMPTCLRITTPNPVVSQAALSAPSPALTSTGSINPTATSTPTPSVTPAVCAVRPSTLSNGSIAGDAHFIRASQNACEVVAANEKIAVDWNGLPDKTYFLWILQYAPYAQVYYPKEFQNLGLVPSSGHSTLEIPFGALEPYEVILVLADTNANNFLRRSAKGFNGAWLQGIVIETDSMSVYRTE